MQQMTMFGLNQPEKEEEKINIHSMFDGISCGRLAAVKAGLKIDKYFASEVDKYAMKVTQHHFSDTIQLGNALNYREWDLPKIDLCIGGSPCQDLSKIKSKDGLGLDGDKSKLFYTFYDNLNLVNPKNFLLENVLMSDKDANIISSMLGVEPVIIDSGNFSAQNRPRLYWTNINFDKNMPTNDLVLKDIMESEVDEKYYYNDKPYEIHSHNKRVIGNMNTHNAAGKRQYTDLTSRIYNTEFKCATLTAVSGGGQEKKAYNGKGVRKLTPLEYERLQTVPDNYTSILSDSQRYKTLGNGWTVDVIAHILGGLK